MLSTAELHKETKEKKSLRNIAYNEVLKECYMKLRMKNKQGQKCMMYKVPAIVFGYPLYDINELTTFIVRKLQKGGFVVYMNQGGLLISWEKEKKQPTKAVPLPVVKRVQFQSPSVPSAPPALMYNNGKLTKKDIEKRMTQMIEYRNRIS